MNELTVYQQSGLPAQPSELAKFILILPEKIKAMKARWDKVWENSLCQRYRRPDHEDHWIWSYDFFNAPICDLQQIAALIGAK